MENNLEFKTENSEQTQKVAFEFASKLKPGDIVLLDGELGSGKTEFAKGICNYFEVEDLVTSPTFTIINQYISGNDTSGLSIYHIDLYRLKDIKELKEIGLNEILNNSDSIKVIEWCFKLPIEYPDDSYLIKFECDPKENDSRIIKISRFTNNKPN